MKIDLVGAEDVETLSWDGVLAALGDWHSRLGDVYSELQLQRSTPLFALEHALDSADVDSLSALVRRAVRLRALRSDLFLPYVVYATELGYRYEGDEYWPTFAHQTPGWGDRDRDFIRASFIKFARTYDGIRPGGPWASQFRIIAWPITHAVLPTDLQRHLARLLYEYRYSLDAEILQDPTRLGSHLASYAWSASKRFQQFAENTQLLGQVAAALLASGEDADGQFLEPTTLHRVVADLNRERQSRFWLQTAKKQVSETRLRRKHGTRASTERSERPPNLDPKVTLVGDSDKRWRLVLEFPDMSPLAARFPQIGQELRDHRVEVGGTGGRMLPRQQLLYPRQRVVLNAWPNLDEPLLRVDRGSDLVNALISDQASFLPGPPWLFRVTAPGMAVGTRGHQVHVGEHYLIALPTNVSPEVSWMAAADMATSGACVWEVHVPSPLSSADASVLESLGLGVIAHIDVRPVGPVPAAWDRAAAIEWVAGNEMIIGVWCDRSSETCVITGEAGSERMTWPAGSDTIFVRFDDLDAGEYAVQLAAYAESDDEPLERIDLSLAVRLPDQTREGGDPREGLAIFSDPARPTISEIWDRQAALEIVGPDGFSVDVDVALMQRARKLVTKVITLPLPISTSGWSRAFSESVREAQDVQRRYDEADAIDIIATHDRLGRVELKCEREFRSLRWVFRTTEDVTVAKLIDFTDRAATTVHVSPFDHPFRHEPVSLDSSNEIGLEEGGLLTAKGSGDLASVIVPPAVRTLEDLSRVMVAPRFPRFERSLDGVAHFLTVAEAWSVAESPGTFAAETARVQVTNAIASEMASLLGGAQWRQVEHLLARSDGNVSVRQLTAAVGDSARDRRLAVAVRSAVTGIVDARSVFARVRIFGGALALGGYRAPHGMSDALAVEALLRLVSDPASLSSWPNDQVESVARSALSSPAVARAARFAIISIALDQGDLSQDQRQIWL